MATRVLLPASTLCVCSPFSRFRVNGKDYNLALWDTAGQEDYDQLRPLSYPQTDIFLLCFSVISPQSFLNVREKWFPEIQHHTPDVPFIIVGTHVDFREDPVIRKVLAEREMAIVTREEGERMATEIRAEKHIECSATSRYKLDDAFKEVSALCLLLTGPGSTLLTSPFPQAIVAAISNSSTRSRYDRFYKSPSELYRQPKSSVPAAEIVSVSLSGSPEEFECPTCQQLQRSHG